MGLIMRQVPKHLLIGNGRVARQMAQYFHPPNIPFMSWHRNQPQLNTMLQQATHVMHIHFSGSVVYASFVDCYEKLKTKELA